MVKRFDIGGMADGGIDVQQFHDGHWVKYEDFAELQQERDALAAENAAIKDGVSDITFMDDDSFFGSTVKAQAVMGNLVNIKTPATDAFLNSVRAEGVDMFGAWQKELAHQAQGDLRYAYVGSVKDANVFAAQLRTTAPKGDGNAE